MALSKTTIARIHRVKSLVIRGLKKFLTFLLSHVGLTVAVAAYGMLGGIIFRNLEAPYEIDQRLKAVETRQKLAQRFLELVDSMDISNSSAGWSEQADVMLLEFQEEVFSLTDKSGWDGMEVDDELQWSFAGALLYSVTVITTIGYGHIAPKTSWGRIVTILYAIFGIPLTLLCLRNIGTFLGACVRLVYKYSCVKLIKQYKLFRRQLYHSRRLKYLTELARKRGLHLKLNEGRAEFVSKDPNEDNSEAQDVEENNSDTKPTLKIKSSVDSFSDILKTVPKEAKQTKVRVPVTLTFMILAGYIIGGAIMFGLWEKEWDILIGSYFCFITLSTIGFGDFVPGTNVDSWSSQEKNIICSAYLLFGMAIMAMCFHLLQEEVRLKCRRLAERIGLFKQELIKDIE